MTDFGASRELQQGEEFLSYYGTEEYLVSLYIMYVLYVVIYVGCVCVQHPEMYERALINPHMRKTFSAKVCVNYVRSSDNMLQYIGVRLICGVWGRRFIKRQRAGCPSSPT